MKQEDLNHKSNRTISNNPRWLILSKSLSQREHPNLLRRPRKLRRLSVTKHRIGKPWCLPKVLLLLDLDRTELLGSSKEQGRTLLPTQVHSTEREDRPWSRHPSQTKGINLSSHVQVASVRPMSPKNQIIVGRLPYMTNQPSPLSIINNQNSRRNVKLDSVPLQTRLLDQLKSGGEDPSGRAHK